MSRATTIALVIAAIAAASALVPAAFHAVEVAVMKEAAYERARLDDHLSAERRAEIMERHQ